MATLPRESSRTPSRVQLIALGENELRRSKSLGRKLNYINRVGARMSRSEQQRRTNMLAGTSNGNRLSGGVYKGLKCWLAKLPALPVMTQGLPKGDPYAMVKDLLETLVNLPKLSIHVDPDEEGGFEVTSNGRVRRDSV